MKGQSQNRKNEKSTAGTSDIQEQKSEKDECKICHVKVLDNEKAIKCDICERWCHIKCIGMEEKAYKFHCREELQWVCTPCIEGKKKMIYIN